MRFNSKSTFIACAAIVAASSAFAQKAGDNIVGLGLAYVSPNTSLGTLSNGSSAAGLGYNGYTVGQILTGTTAKVSSETTVSLGLLHMFTDSVGAEFTIGIPPRVTQDLNGTSSSHPGAAKIDVWTPTVVGKYFFGTPQDTWRPYAGLGVSRVSFHNISTLNDGGLISALAGTSASLTSSWTPVYNAGVIYNLDDKWSINGSVSYLPIKTSATFVGAAGTTTGDVKLNTTDYVIRLGYKF